MNETEVIINVRVLQFHEVWMLFPVTDVAALFTFTPVEFLSLSKRWKHC
jgi:hypothetical protein